MKDFSISIGFYPGFLFGIRTYKKEIEDDQDEYRLILHHVLYLPFVDICLTIEPKI
jgi:hypothetical protein|tara:strand:+ start:813 stop:980 length:168 start_codon:yes stop_codon:yes gene_type:complete